MITCRCPHCARSFELCDTLAGRTAHCNACGQSFVIPEPERDWIDSLPEPLADLATDCRDWLQADPRRQFAVAAIAIAVLLAATGYWQAGRTRAKTAEPIVEIVDEPVAPVQPLTRHQRPSKRNIPKQPPHLKVVITGHRPAVARKPRWNPAAAPSVQVFAAEPPRTAPVNGIWRLAQGAWQSAHSVAGATPDGRLLAYDVGNTTVNIVNTTTMHVIAKLRFPQEVNTFAPSALLFSPDGHSLAIVRKEYVGTRIGRNGSRQASQSVWLYDTRTWKKRGLLTGPRDYWDAWTSYVRHATAWAFSANSRWIAIAYGGNIRIHDATTGQLVNAWNTGKATVTSVAFAGADRRLVSGDENGVLRITNLITRETEKTLPLNVEIRRLRVMPNELLVVELDHLSRLSVGFQLEQGRLTKTLWMKRGVTMSTDGKRLVCRETVGADKGIVPAIVFYDAEKSFLWRDLILTPPRMVGQLLFVGDLLVSRSDYAQLLVIQRDAGRAVAIGEMRLPTKPMTTSGATMNNLGLNYHAGSRHSGYYVERLWPVGERFVLASHNDGRLDLIDLTVAAQSAFHHRPTRVAVSGSAVRSWTDGQNRHLTARLTAVTDGVLELEGAGKTRQVPFLNLSVSDQQLLAGSQIVAESRTWHPIGASSFTGRAIRYRPPYVDIESQDGRTITVPLARMKRVDHRYLKWLRTVARSRFLPMVQDLVTPDPGRIARAQAEESALQGVWQVGQGPPARMPAQDRFVYIVGNQLFMPLYISRQKTQWAQQRFCVMTEAKPHKRLDRFQSGNNYHAAIFQRKGNTMRLQLGIGQSVPETFRSDTWILKRVRPAISFDEALTITTRYQEVPR